jgi:uncharacterized membrane protein
MWEYWLLALTTWLIGFLPWAGIHIAIPVAMAAGMDKGSAIFWAALGNYTPLAVVHFAYERLLAIKWVGPRLQRFRSDRWRPHVDRYGPWFVLIALPWIGVWTVGVSTKVSGMDSRPLLVSGFISLALYSVILAYLAALGINWLWG